MATNIATKRRMVRYANGHDIEVPPLNVWSPVWGLGAKRLAWRVSGHMHDNGHPEVPQTNDKTPQLVAVLFPPPYRVIEVDYRWNGDLGRRYGEPPFLVHHHEAGSGLTAQQIHAYHVSLGWRGIAYHYYVRKDGSIYRGRPEWAIGGHTHEWGNTIGICCEGNFENEYMTDKQLGAVRWLVRDIHKRHAVADRRHRDMPSNATACPGRHYPFDAVRP